MRGELHTLQSRGDMLGQRVSGVVARLKEFGFRVERTGDAFPGPDPRALSAIERRSRETGAAIVCT